MVSAVLMLVMSNYNVALKTLLQERLSEPEFPACNDFSTQLCKIILPYITIG